ncbi:LON peptidase substrate-binding domain-containing protein [Paraferrimonas haliotis]|uniref:LON peptidase substrate-binding domain-containing protein n=1 Tax=Paraferrimonas haliotis TaxID=2013866 RepID=UPI000BA9848F|nr:LON peptidase substrate-binding domain-containing protein [Paraferrimonas haliotis]
MRTERTNLIILEQWILPQGRLELRITQPEVMQLVVDHFKQDTPIALGVINEEATANSLPCLRYATACRIIDFFQLDDNTTSFVFEGLHRLRVVATHLVSESLWKAQVIRLPDWPSYPLASEYEVLSTALKYFYEENPDLLELYPDAQLDDANWVSQRWLEVLPIIAQDKQALLSQPNCQQAMSFVLKLIIEKQQ